MYSFGDIVLAELQFVDIGEIKIRPALVLFEEAGNIVVAGITSNTKMNGVKLTKAEGAVKDSVIKMNYIFTISEFMIKKPLFKLSSIKKRIIVEELNKRLK